MIIRFLCNTSAMIDGVATYFTAGTHEVPDEVGAVLVGAGDALPVGAVEAEEQAEAEAPAETKEAEAPAEQQPAAQPQAKAKNRK